MISVRGTKSVNSFCQSSKCNINWCTCSKGIYIIKISVDKNERCKGVGTKALTEFINRHKGNNIYLYALGEEEVPTSKLEVWYESLGFKKKRINIKDIMYKCNYELINK